MLEIYLLVILIGYSVPILITYKLKNNNKGIILTFFYFKFIEYIFISLSLFFEWNKTENIIALHLNLIYVILVTYTINLIYVWILWNPCVRNIFKISNIKKNKYYEIHFLIIATVIYIFYLYSNNFIGITNPREAYQNNRSGYGFLWAGYIFFISLWVFIRIHNKKNYLITFLVYFVACYQSGSKGLLLTTVVPFIAYGVLFKELPKYIIISISVLIIFGMLNLFSFFDDPSLIVSRLESYFDMFKNSTRVFQDYLDDELVFEKGSIYLSNIWQYVPRILYPDKPYAWGVASLVEVYYPGIAHIGTPSFGLYASEFFDVGFFGVLLVLLKIEQILIFTSIFILSRNYGNERVNFCSSAILILPGFYFHVPILISLIIFNILLIKNE